MLTLLCFLTGCATYSPVVVLPDEARPGAAGPGNEARPGDAIRVTLLDGTRYVGKLQFITSDQWLHLDLGGNYSFEKLAIPLNKVALVEVRDQSDSSIETFLLLSSLAALVIYAIHGFSHAFDEN